MSGIPIPNSDGLSGPLEAVTIEIDMSQSIRSARALDAFFEHWMEETRQDQSMRRVLWLAFAWGAFYQQNLAPKPE